MRLLSVSETLSLGAKHGIGVAKGKRPGDAVNLPAYVKPDTSEHKSEKGLVILAKTPGELEEAIGKIGRENAIIQEAIYGTELILGAKRDPVFGTVVLVGIGGTLAEAYSDAQTGVMPLSEKDALEMVLALKAQKILDGFRGKPPVERDALAKLILLVGKLAEEEGLSELDFNPVIGNGSRLVAVDGRAAID